MMRSNVMRPNLDNLRPEIEQHLETRGMAVFFSYPRESQGSLTGAVHWDAENHPNYREFVEAAYTTGVRVMTLSAREFTPDVVETALAHLSDLQLDQDEREPIDTRLNEIRGYEGATYEIELSFDHDQRTYLFELRADWFDELNSLLDRIARPYERERRENPLRTLILK